MSTPNLLSIVAEAEGQVKLASAARLMAEERVAKLEASERETAARVRALEGANTVLQSANRGLQEEVRAKQHEIDKLTEAVARLTKNVRESARGGRQRARRAHNPPPSAGQGPGANE